MLVQLFTLCSINSTFVPQDHKALSKTLGPEVRIQNYLGCLEKYYSVSTVYYLHSQQTLGQYSILKYTNISAVKHVNIYASWSKTVNSLMSVQVRFCFQVSSGEVRFCCQMSHKNSVCRAVWILEMQVRVSGSVVPVSVVGLPSPLHSHSDCRELRITERERRACWKSIL